MPRYLVSVTEEWDPHFHVYKGGEKAAQQDDSSRHRKSLSRVPGRVRVLWAHGTQVVGAMDVLMSQTGQIELPVGSRP